MAGGLASAAGRAQAAHAVAGCRGAGRRDGGGVAAAAAGAAAAAALVAAASIVAARGHETGDRYGGGISHADAIRLRRERDEGAAGSSASSFLLSLRVE